MKKLAVLFILLMTVLALTACGNQGSVDFSPLPNPTKPAPTDHPCKDGHAFVDTEQLCTRCGADYYAETLVMKLSATRDYFIVDGLGTCQRDEIVIPSTYKGLPVRELSGSSFNAVSNPVCALITKVTIPSSITKINNNAFYKCTGLTEVTIPEGVTELGTDIFKECKNLESISFPTTVTEIPERIVYLCDNLKHVEIKGQITSIGSSAFQQCISLESLVIPESLKTVGTGAFSGCTNLQTLKLPSTLESISRQVVDNCPMLQYNVYEGMNYLGNDNNPYVVLIGRADENQKVVNIHKDASVMMPTALEMLDITSVTIPAKMTVPYNSLMKLPKLETIEVETGHPVYHTAGNCLIETATKKLIRGTANSVIPNDGSVTMIEASAFAYLQNLTSVTIPESITHIGGGAFSQCVNLNTLVLGTGLTRIDLSAFSGCKSLTVFYAGTSTQWGYIDIPVSIGGGGMSFGDNHDLLNAPRYYYSETEPSNPVYYWHYVDGVPTPWQEQAPEETPEEP